MTGLGIGLLMAGVVLLVAEAHTPAGGGLGALGLVAAVAGTVMAVTGAGGGLALSLVLALIVAAIVGGALLAAARAIGRTRPRRVRSGREALIGAGGRARQTLGANGGHVVVEGALWQARNADSDEPVRAGDPIVVERIDGLTLTVRRAELWELDP
jgi:membrane-bound ClpP family serine protease